jgi:hypothetical protein
VAVVDVAVSVDEVSVAVIVDKVIVVGSGVVLVYGSIDVVVSVVVDSS